ncbi:hypothetical protein C8046_15250 [Serinibacter arcticus]|uniref:Lipoprotein n=1 Tax=Serinibacter arcticus TaxID=1655435 RepID=A0A2U1ZXT9_9MICO|nr:hypothetical protein [Serinibacter arcticus]PWD51799.1 hypothetical protein C8046_15250 [Serinibacter arcticus]
MPPRTHAVAALALVAGIALAGCDASPAPLDPRSEPLEVTVDLGPLAFTVEAPDDLSTPDPDDPAEDATAVPGCWTASYELGGRLMPSGADDDSTRITFGVSQDGCPDDSALNGRFPAWASTAQLPDDAELVDLGAQFASVHRFTVDYEQCTNECYGELYTVYFAELPGGETFFTYVAGLDETAAEEILATLAVVT